MPDITGFGHVDLSVTDLDRSEAWYTKVLGAKRVIAQRVDDPGYEVRVFVEPQSMTLFALFRHDRNAQQPTSFDFNRSGLDHVALAVAERDVDREPHPERVHHAAGPEHQHAVDPLPADETPPAQAPRDRDLGRRQHVVAAHEPGHLVDPPR